MALRKLDSFALRNHPHPPPGGCAGHLNSTPEEAISAVTNITPAYHAGETLWESGRLALAQVRKVVPHRLDLAAESVTVP
jgi:hypothetical protein